MQNEYDLIIAGAGLAGNCLALALKNSGLQIAIVETCSREELRNSPIGDRALALAAGTVQLLEMLGIWSNIASKATAIKQIHISERGHFGKTRLSATEQGVEALGYVIQARDIEEHVADLVAQTHACQYYGARVAGLISGQDAINVSLKQQGKSLNLSAQLLVGADGGQSTIRRLLEIPQKITDYAQTAIVANIKTALPHQNTAFERFTPFGPLAILPGYGKNSSLVWTRNHEQAEALINCGETEFLAELQSCFGYRLGALQLVSPVRAFPLSLIRAESMISDRCVIIGNAVHQLHPVAGQGFNLGIRDVAHLAEILIEQSKTYQDIGDSKLLNAYVKKRKSDHDKVIGFTDNVVRIFSNDFVALSAIRNTGLILLDHLPAAKRLLIKHAMGFAQILPKLGSN